jgi:hypothetical protein
MQKRSARKKRGVISPNSYTAKEEVIAYRSVSFFLLFFSLALVYMKFFSPTIAVFVLFLIAVIQTMPTAVLKREGDTPGLTIRKGLPFKNEENGLTLPDQDASNNGAIDFEKTGQ